MPPAPEYTKKKIKKPRKPRKITSSYLHNAGLYYLERFSASSGQFREVMMRKIKKSCQEHKEQSLEECQDILEKLIVRFQDNGLLNDRLYAQGIIATLYRAGKSQRAIEYKLKKKHIPSALIKTTLQYHLESREITPQDAEFKAALTLTRKRRLGAFEDPLRERPRDKALAILARAGFSYDIAQKALDIDKEEAEDILFSIHSL